MERQLAAGARHDVVGQVAADRVQQFAGGGPAVRGGGRLRLAGRAGPPGRGRRGGVRVQQQEQVPLLLAHPAADRGQLDRAVRAGQVRPGLVQADDPPAERAEDLPPAQLGQADIGPARGPVGGQQLLARAQADRRARPEPPRLHAQPAKVLARAARVHLLPVDDRVQRLRADDQVAEPQVAVHGHAFPRRRRVGLQRGQRPLEHRAGRAEPGQYRAQPGQRIRGGQVRGHVQRVQARGEPAELAGQHLPRGRVGAVAQDPPGDGLARHPAHHQPGRPPQLRAVVAEQHLGHGQPGGPGRRDRRGLPAHRPRLARPARRVPAQHQAGPGAVRADGVERPGLPGRAAGHPGQPLDGDRAEHAPQRGREPRRQLRRVRHRPVTPAAAPSAAPAAAPPSAPSSVTPLGARWRMKPNMYPATRRIWISSAPSVIR